MGAAARAGVAGLSAAAAVPGAVRLPLQMWS